MTVEQVLHALWSNSESALEKTDEKRLWMLLQEFIIQKGGSEDDAYDYDVRGGIKPLGAIRPSKKGLLSVILARVKGD